MVRNMMETLANLESYLDSLNFKDEKLHDQTPVFNKSKVFKHLYVNVRLLEWCGPVRFQIIIQAPTETGEYICIERSFEFDHLCTLSQSGVLKRSLNGYFSEMMAEAGRKICMDLITENKI